MIDYKNQLTSIDRTTTLENIPEGAIGYVLFRLFYETKYKFIAHLVDNNTEIEFIKSEIGFYDDSINILEFSDWDTVPYDVSSPSIDIQSKRIETLYNLTNCDCSKEQKTLILISRKSCLQKIIGLEDFNSLVLKLNVGQKISVDSIVSSLENNCYNRIDTAVAIGDYAVNNGKIDIVTFQNCSFRITINKDIIEDLRFFDPLTQIVHDSYGDILILPMGEVVLNKNNIQNFRSGYRYEFGIPEEKDRLYSTISSGKVYNGMENWLPMFYNNKLGNIFDYLPSNALISYNFDIHGGLKEEYKNIEKYYGLREKDESYNAIPIDSLYIDLPKFDGILGKYINVIFSETKGDVGNTIDLGFEQIPRFHESSANKNAFTKVKEFIIAGYQPPLV